MESRQITLYSQPFGGPCAALAEYLTSKKVEFVHKDVMIDEEAREELVNLGVRSAPALVVDGEVAAGFDKKLIDRLLDLGSKPLPKHTIIPGFLFAVTTAQIKLPDGVLDLIAEVKNSGQPRLAREAVNQMLRFKDKVPNAHFVFIAPDISSKFAEICESEGIGYLELSGNGLLSFYKTFIQKIDYPTRFKEKRDLKSLFTPKAERLLRVLLCNPGKKWNINNLAVESGVSLGQASNVKKILFDREFISGKRGEFRLIDPLTLLREWAENYDYRKNVVQEFYSLKSIWIFSIGAESILCQLGII